MSLDGWQDRQFYLEHDGVYFFFDFLVGHFSLVLLFQHHIQESDSFFLACNGNQLTGGNHFCF